MKQKKSVETTIVFDLEVHDIIKWLNTDKLIPSDWHSFSVEVQSKGISNGAVITIKNISIPA